MKIGIIGGSGLEKGDVIQNLENRTVETPYGDSKLKEGSLYGEKIYIISRHGEKHEITPTNVNNRANIYALKKLGCKYILATTAVGSLREEIPPEDFVIVDQFIDFTKHRKTTFFEDFKDGVNHTVTADPFSEELRNYLIDSCKDLGFKYHPKGTVITIEGPRLSTRAESKMFQRWGADIINMSTAPEAALAKESKLEYAAIAMSTDYDCWRGPGATWEEINKVMDKNSEKVKKVLVRTIEKISSREGSIALRGIKNKIRTIPDFPKPGIMFRDVTTLFKNPQGLKQVIDIFYNRYKEQGIDKVVGIESRGFILAGSLAEKLNCGFVPIRKKGKLPAETISQEYSLEYGTDSVEIHKDAIDLEEKVLLIDDLIATGGTAKASAELIEKLGGKIVECAFVVDLPDLKGKEKLSKWPVFSLVEFKGE
jgi:5'-methylthioadenosine phosphorylase